MRSLWSKISLGAVGVFLVGMLLITGFRRSREAVTNAVSGALVPALHAAATYAASTRTDLPFRLDGTRLGTVTRMQLERAEANQPMSVRLVVQLDDEVDTGDLQRCDLLSASETDVDFEHGFRCGERGGPGLVEIGEVRFEPAGFTRPVKAGSAQLSKLRDGDPFRANIDLTHGMHLDAHGRNEGSVRVQADSTGAVMRVRDRKGGDLVRISADSNHAFIQIRDESGKVVFRLQAGDSGVNMTAGNQVESP